MIISAIRKDRQERLDWIHERLEKVGRPTLPAGPLAIAMRFEYPPVKSMTKKALAAMKAGQDVPRVVHPTVTALADLIIEELLPFTPARVSRLTVEKVITLASPKVTILVEVI
jgi:hypothetical protein